MTDMLSTDEYLKEAEAAWRKIVLNSEYMPINTANVPIPLYDVDIAAEITEAARRTMDAEFLEIERFISINENAVQVPPSGNRHERRKAAKLSKRR